MLRAVPVTMERVTVNLITLIVLRVSSVERITAGTSETLLNHLLTAALKQVKIYIYKRSIDKVVGRLNLTKYL